MGDPSKLRSLLSTIPRFLQCTIFACTLLFISIHLIYLYSEQPLTLPEQDKDKYFLHSSVFTQNPYKNMINSLNTNKYSIIQSDCQQCVQEFIKFYGYQSGKVIVNRGHHELEGNDAVVMPVLWQIRAVIDSYIPDQLDGKDKTWVFWVHKTLPKEQIQQLKSLQPKSSIVVVSLSNIPKLKSSLKGFKDIGKIPTFTLQSILKKAKIPKKQAQAYINFYKGSIARIFSQIGPESKKIQQQLDQYYVNIDNISKKSKDLLKSFCANSNFVKNKLSQKVIGELESVGVKVSDAGKFGWFRREYVLNYMLQSYENCQWSQELLVNQDKVQKLVEVKEVKDQPKQCICQCNTVGPKSRKTTKKSNKKSKKTVQTIPQSQTDKQNTSQNTEQTTTAQTIVDKQNTHQEQQKLPQQNEHQTIEQNSQEQKQQVSEQIEQKQVHQQVQQVQNKDDKEQQQKDEDKDNDQDQQDDQDDGQENEEEL